MEALPLRQALRRLAGTVCIIAAGRRGERRGLTATAVTSLCLEPPALLVCVNGTSSTYRAMIEQRRFSVNVLALEQVDQARTFSSTDVAGEHRFSRGQWLESVQGIPHLRDANAAVLCELESALPYGSHVAVVGRVTDVHLGLAEAAAPLLYFDGDYRTLLPDRS
jgi:flavin reductase (DIM6/NTAB) family NADH-FMN oxidoreductase RutF